MESHLAVIDENSIQILPDQIKLIRNTVAKDATPEELELYFYDCKRRNVHPLDKLIHFTKRNGKYTPITSIDFMRQRAHATKLCAGISDAVFEGQPKEHEFVARVTVKRITEGMVCDFSASARWSEYCPPKGQDFMWHKMPHCMLAKCAEALALRKAFPHELQGLYEASEMDQAGRQEVTAKIKEPERSSSKTETAKESQSQVEPGANDGAMNTYFGIVKGIAEKEGLKKDKKTKWHRYGVQGENDVWYNTFSETVGEFCKTAKDNNAQISFSYETTDKGVNILEILPL